LSLESNLAQEEKELKEMKTIEEILKDLRKALDAYLPKLREQVKEVQKMATRTTTERPMLALGVAFLVGVALGIALSRAKD
jgi:ElaB/YqjD/DUF883 family membrane-anchored ribosome-binding protein